MTRDDSPDDIVLNPEARWFGETEVAPDDKTAAVRDVFARVAPRYDLMNDLMSGGIHRFWKAAFVRRLRPRKGERIVDLAGGTGDIAHRIQAVTGGAVRLVLCDISEAMVRVGRDRGIDRGWLGAIDHVVGSAEALPFPARSVDAVTIAFGLRNVTRIDASLAEARRVLRPGGRFFCLEFSHVRAAPAAVAYDAYSRAVIPALGAWILDDRDSYQYLIESIRRFPDQQTLAGRMELAGLERVGFTNLSGGIGAIHWGWRI